MGHVARQASVSRQHTSLYLLRGKRSCGTFRIPCASLTLYWLLWFIHWVWDPACRVPCVEDNQLELVIQKELAWSMQCIWHVQVHACSHLLPETLFLCVNIIDHFWFRIQWLRVTLLSKLQLVGIIMCLLTTSKAEEIAFHISLPSLCQLLTHWVWDPVRRALCVEDIKAQTSWISKYLWEVRALEWQLSSMAALLSLITTASIWLARLILSRIQKIHILDVGDRNMVWACMNVVFLTVYSRFNSFLCSPTMPSQQQSCRTKYNYSDETLTRLIPCSNCGKQFKTQGIKQHEVSCKAQSEAEKDSAAAGCHYEKALRGEYTLFEILMPVNVWTNNPWSVLLSPT